MIEKKEVRKTSNEVRPVENTNKNRQSFPKIRPVEKKVPHSQNLHDHAYEQ